MKHKAKKTRVAIVVLCLCMILTSSIVFAGDVDVKQISDKSTNDTNKVWTVSFTGNIDFDSVKNSIQVKDKTDGSKVDVTITKGDDEASVKINPPSQGYTKSHNYEIKIDKNIAKSKTLVSLNKTALMNFTVSGSDTATNTTTDNYTASANIVVAPAFPVLKQITVKSTTIPNAKKYKVNENPNMFNIGAAMVVGVAENATTVSFYDANGNKLGEATLNVDKSLNNMTLQVTKQD